ncbi:phosphorylcholine transferase LicD [Alkalibacterium putridalgicola]|uniref:LicD family protein n=1 Tax=Alkalibacterium putridalgicola TaxID=426703 RepID=UPI0034CFCE73
MSKIELKEQKKIMTEILVYIDRLAAEHNLTYSLWGGTMLGAVRHKGYIPWDDDIDISMPREDYEKLIDILKDKEDYDLYEYSIQDQYTQGWAKLAHKGSIDKKGKFFGSDISHGVFVDIMPIDGFPSTETEIRKFKKEVRQAYLLVRSANFPSYASSISLIESLKRLILAFPLYLSSKRRGGKTNLVTELNRLSKIYSIKNSDKCGHLLSRYKGNLGYPSSIWDEIKDYDFEGYRFKGIAASDTYLSLLYGENYMDLPPKDKQITHDEHEFFVKDVN